MTKGILIVNKPVGYTSRDIVNIVSKSVQTKKVGHTGTLDPIAEGVLVICVGRYTKLVPMLTALDKEYIAEIKLGIKTDTLDITGEILEKQDFKITQEEIENVFESFVGEYRMEVPVFSAIKVKGKKLYEYARSKEKVELPIKNVQIYELELLDFREDIIKFRVKVEKGTYIRSLIRDICKSLNTVGTMNSLLRTKQGNFSLAEAYTLEYIKNGNYKLANVQEMLSLKEHNLTEEEYKLVKNGCKIT
ncbi:MAG: tRNA pseudouridine(55) synthase TruB, partial [Bacilli bacterium]|nr:tRNA pseudouridine(55) synthase TruB [Bacilli bacterium]